MNIIFQIDGGLGKSIAATAVCKAIKTQYPNDRLVVVTGYPDVFEFNPHVFRVYHHNSPYFYRDFIEGQKVLMMVHNPYLATDFINMEGHLIQVWCEMFGVKYNGETPELFMTRQEFDQYAPMFKSDKPIFALQTNGGAPNGPRFAWPRDLPMSVANRVVAAFAREYNIVHIRHKDQPALQGTYPIHAAFRPLAALIWASSRRLFIDSFAQHAAAAVGKPSVVCWTGNTPQQFGYSLHTNIVAHPPTVQPQLRNAQYTRYNIGGDPLEFPYRSEDEIFDTHAIIEALRNDHKPAIAPPLLYLRENGNTREKIMTAYNKGGMVAGRLVHLLGKENLGNVKRVVDIGSWHLRQSIEFAEIFPNAAIDAFEPVPDSYALCLSNLAQQPPQVRNRIKVHNFALSNQQGEAPFFAIDPAKQQGVDAGFSSMFRFMDTMNGMAQNGKPEQQEIVVPTETLDNWCATNGISEIDIMWIDVQGAELLVFQGAQTILMNTRIILTEVGLKPYYEGHTLKEDIDQLLLSLGFEELKSSFEMNIAGYEANTIYYRRSISAPQQVHRHSEEAVMA